MGNIQRKLRRKSDIIHGNKCAIIINHLIKNKINYNKVKFKESGFNNIEIKQHSFEKIDINLENKEQFCSIIKYFRRFGCKNISMRTCESYTDFTEKLRHALSGEN